MKCTVSAPALAEALASASQVIPRTPTLVAYSAAQLVVDGDTLTVSASDGDTTVLRRTTVQQAHDGSVLLVPKPLQRWLAAQKKATQVSLTAENPTELVVAVPGNAPYTFRTMAATLPASAPVVPVAPPVDLTGLGEAAAAVHGSADSLSSSSKEPVVQLMSGPFGLRLNTTDRFRVTRATIPAGGVDPFTVLVPWKVVELAAKLTPTNVCADTSTRMLTFYGPTSQVSTRLIDQPFPPVDKVVDAKPGYQIAVPAPMLVAALERLACVAEPGRPLMVGIDGDEVVLSMVAVNVGSGREVMTLPTPAPTAVTFGVNLDFFSQAVHSAGSASMTLGWTSPRSPVVISSPAPLDVVSVVMPVAVT